MNVEGLSHVIASIQLIPISVASSTVHGANLEPGSKMSLEKNVIGNSGASALADTPTADK